MSTHSSVTEAELIAKSKAPRVTEKALDDNIKSITYINAGDATGPISRSADLALNLLTICVIVLENGFTVVGTSACASPENFDEDIGKCIAYENARRQIWPLMGYELRQRLEDDRALLEDRAFAPDDAMGTYIGTKVVDARPMTKKDYCVLRNWAVPMDEDPDELGYLVEYTDRVQRPPTVNGFQGYVSWSPRAVFEHAYRQVGWPEGHGRLHAD